MGTKLDLIRFDDDLTQRIEADLKQRLIAREKETVRELNEAIVELKREIGKLTRQNSKENEALKVSAGLSSRLDELTTLKTERPRILSYQLNAMSSADLTGLSSIRAALEDLIVTSDTSFIMPPDYLQLSAYIQNKVKAMESQSIRAKIDTLFVNASALHDEIRDQPAFASLDSNDITAILHTFHSIGDILWFDGADDILWFDNAGCSLCDTVFLSPALVIDFVRKIVNHKLGEDENDALHSAVRDEGRVAHTLLRSLKLWSEVDDDLLMLQLNGLLLRFQLAYPDRSAGLKWNSDLIVPIYWKKKSTSSDATMAALDAQPDGLGKRVRWEYEFPSELPESLFEKLGVASYSAHFSCDRSYTAQAFSTKRAGQYYAQIAKSGVKGGVSVLRVTVWANSLANAWKQLIWYAISIERLLESYLGLWVTRVAVSRTEKRLDIERLITECSQSMLKCASQ